MCSKVYFRYGCINSSKTLNLLAVAHTYKGQNKRSILIRKDANKIQSSSPLVGKEVDIVLGENLIDRSKLDNVSVILIDDAHRLSSQQVDDIRNIATTAQIPVICYGLRTGIDQRATEGSIRLLEIADQISEIKTTCINCPNKAIFSRRSRTSEDIEAVCALCYGGIDE